MSASKVLSDLQWVDEKLIRPYAVLVKAMQEAAEVEQGVAAQTQLLSALKAQVLILDMELTDKRATLQTLETTDTQRIAQKMQALERSHTTRMTLLDSAHQRAVDDHTKQLAQMTAERETYRASLDQTQLEYKGAHHRLQAEHDACADACRQEMTVLTAQLTTLKTKHANFLKEVGHVVH